jgi:LysM repeat protein
LVICPLLESSGGGWRNWASSREHRCWAVTPPAPLAPAKQQQLCLTAAYRTCATHIAASGTWASPGDHRAPVAPTLLWASVRSTPLTLEPPRGRFIPLGGVGGRAGGQALLVTLMVLAFMVLIVARTTVPSTGGSAAGTDTPGQVQGSSAPSSAGVPSSTLGLASEDPTPSGGAAPTPSAPASAPASSAPVSPTPVPSAARSYKVRSGDTLSSIAARYGTTVKALMEANGIANASLIRVGQVLIIP